MSIPTDVYAEVDQTLKHWQDITKMTVRALLLAHLLLSPTSRYARYHCHQMMCWEKISALSGSGARSLVSNASSLLSSMITDMNPNQLLELVEIVQPIGVSNLEHDEAPVVEGSSALPLTLRP